ncbi:thiamine pyrophosphokinase [Entomortierella parvispora]|uniref:Thiamine pyrophosphokinase n=1 Tax=Entomortierella parvispora TaxID=205924 RepID=A0A9P3HHT6_9FUNG|nr:thiamine pyrophosphokinase [Entomortierella parvispora]
MNWQPSKCLESPEEYKRKYVSEETGQGHFALIILNQPILLRRDLFENVWRNAKYRFCADGGANRLYDLHSTDEERAQFLPDYIRGDFDSLRDSVKEYYESKGVPAQRDTCEYSTDFMKCVQLVRARDPSPSTTSTPTSIPSAATEAAGQEQRQKENLGVVALGGTGGRFDQSMSSIHHLYILNRERHACLVSDESIVVVLGPGKHGITCNLEIEGPTCGIIPVGSSVAHLTTSGLKWDVENWKTSFGTQISTSNALVGSEVTIQTDAPVVWTTEIRNKQKS